MTTTPRAARFFLRRVERPALPPEPADDMPFASNDDGFGTLDFRRPADKAPPPAAQAVPQPPAQDDPAEADDAAIAAIAAEGLTGRQLRRARLVAQSRGLSPRSDLDAVLQLRRAGLDPFTGAPALEAVAPPAAPASVEPGRDLARLPGDQVQLPQRARPIAVPSPEQKAEVNQAAEIMRMQQDIARRRRRRLALLAARMLAFVLLPTFLAGWYFYQLATPMYATKAEFMIQQAGPSGGSGGMLGGLFSGTGLATAQDSIAVQGYLQSREAMLRLESDVGFKEHFQDPTIDDLQRLPPDATMEDAYSLYARYVKISYDSSEGIIRMEVIATNPEVASSWARQLVSYAEEQVDQLTQRLRADQMRDAQTGYEEAQTNLATSQARLIELQERFKIISSETEVGLITSQIATLEQQISLERLSLAQMEANPNPNQARMEPIKRRVATLESEIAILRDKLTEGTESETSLAEVQGELLVAQADLQTRQMMLAQSLQSMETARVEANRQVRYLSLSVSPVPTDEPAYPRAFENTMVTMLILLGIYLMVSMTVAILREQVTA
jgi:capsular polysaccharide transport system permease protein